VTSITPKNFVHYDNPTPPAPDILPKKKINLISQHIFQEREKNFIHYHE
jgi:hypothetical protein